MAKVLSEYEPATAKLENDYVKDLLKKLYQYLVPKSIKHDLGEYYTPDWLAEYLLNRLSDNGNPDIRVLDPACGSGTFLTLVLKKIMKQLSSATGNSDMLKKILENVIGFDINPIAVLAARTNYLIGISCLAKLGEDEIEIPIYQSDSVLTPRTYAQLQQGKYTLHTVVG
jgi:type I restriction-modification system DNA methylase subunit